MKKHWILTLCLSWLLAFALGNNVLAQDTQELTQPKVPLEQLLNRDGTIDLNRGFRGSLDPTGWQMMTGPNGEPLFVQAGTELQTVGDAQPMAVPGNIDWIRQFNGLGIFDYIARVSGAAYAGQVYVVGQTFYSPGPFTASTGGVVRLYDTGGNEGWTRQFSGQPYGVAADASGVYIGGMAWDPISGNPLGFLSKYDTNGNEAWTRLFDSSSIAGNTRLAWVSAIALDVSGVYVAGGTADVSGQTSAGEFVRKYDTTGNEAWTRLFETSYWEMVNGVATDNSGVYVVGTMSGSVPLVSTDVIIRKFDASGNAVWTRQFGSASYDYATGIVVDASGVYAAGYTYGVLPGQTSAGEYDAFVRQYDTGGNEGWTRQFGTSTYDYVQGIAVDASGVYVAGYTHGALLGQTNAGSSDVFVRKYDTASNELWTRQFGTSLSEESNGVAADAFGVYVFGHTVGAFPGQTSSGRSDAFVAKIQISLPPIADAGSDQTVIVNATAQLNGSTSNDPDGDPLTYAWKITSKPAGSNATLSNSSIVNPTFVADVAGEYKVSLVVNDGTVNSAPDEVIITAITAQDATQSLIDQVQALVDASTLNQGQGNGLIAKLEAAIQQLDKGTTTIAAINQLRAFINQVNDFMSSTPPLLTAAEGQPLIDAANAIIAALSTTAKAAQLNSGSSDLMSKTEGTLPAGYRLEQNSPNPFNPVTTIQFSVPRESYVRLKVYNSFGAEVATLVDQQVAAGTYKVNWDASRLASGFYLYRLEAEGFAQTKKLLLMK